MSKPHIAFVLPHLRQGGAERSTAIISRGLLARGHRVDLLLLRPRIDAEVAGWIPEGVELFAGGKSTHGELSLTVPPPRVAGLAGDCLRLLRRVKCLPRMRRTQGARLIASYIAHRCPDIVLPSLNDTIISALLARHLVKQAPPIVPIFRGPGKLKQAYRRRLMQDAARVVGVSQGMVEDIRRKSGLPAERFTTIYNPVIAPEMAALKQQSPDHPWFADSGAPIILACGRLTAQKGFDVLLRAFAHLKKMRPCRLIILGEGELRRDFERLISDLGITDSVSLPGWADNPFAYMAQAQLFVLSSNFEGLGRVLLEALACGCPCVSTNCPSGPSEILLDGEIGELTPVGDDRALAEAMQRTLDSPPPREKLIARGEYFSLERAADGYEALIREVAGPC